MCQISPQKICWRTILSHDDPADERCDVSDDQMSGHYLGYDDEKSGWHVEHHNVEAGWLDDLDDVKAG